MFMNKEMKRKIRRLLGWYVLRFCHFLQGFLPLTGTYIAGAVLGKIAYIADVRHRRDALASLSIAFPNLSIKEKKKIARDFFVFMVQSVLEILCFLRVPKYLSNVRIQGRENLDQALKKGKGVIVVSAHLGSFPLISYKLIKEGYKINVVLRPMRDEKADAYFHNLITAVGVRSIFSYPRKECINGIIQALRRNEIVIVQMDQNFGTGGVWVNFFGKLAATPVGPVVFALRTNAAVLPGYIYREAKGKHCITLLPQEELIICEDKDETMLVNVIKLTRLIESWIRKFPCQWGWIHRRWKSRPSEIIKNLKFKMEKV